MSNFYELTKSVRVTTDNPLDGDRYISPTPAKRSDLLLNGFSYINGTEDNMVLLYDKGGVDGRNSIITETETLGKSQSSGTSKTYKVKYRLPGGKIVYRNITINIP